MSAAEVRAATVEDALHIARNLRECDLREVQAAVGEGVEESVLASFMASSLCWCGTVPGGTPFIIFGVAPGPTRGVGIPWMLATAALEEHLREFIRETRWYVELMNSAYPTLFNFVDKRNKSTKRWLRWSGFKLGPVVPSFGVGRVPFTIFYRTRNV